MISIPESYVNNFFYAFKMDPKGDKKVDPDEPGYDVTLDLGSPGITTEDLISSLDRSLPKNRVTAAAAIWVLAQTLGSNQQVEPIRSLFDRLIINNPDPLVKLVALDYAIEAESKLPENFAGILKEEKTALLRKYKNLKSQSEALKEQVRQRLQPPLPPSPLPPPPAVPKPGPSEEPGNKVKFGAVEQILLDKVMRHRLGLTENDLKSYEGWGNLSFALYGTGDFGYALSGLNGGAKTPADAYWDDFYLPGEVVRIWDYVRKE